MIFASSLIVGGVATAAAMHARELFWLGWLSAVPLFAAVRWLRPGQAGVSGGLWGLALLASHTFLTGESFGPGMGPLMAVVAGPALFGWLLSVYRRWNGFDPLTLAVGWLGVELLAAAAGMERGILAGTQNEFVVTGLGGQFFGYLFVALFIANTGALLTGPFGARRAVPDSALRRWIDAFSHFIRLCTRHLPRRLESSSRYAPRAPPIAYAVL
ncbi:MAG: hypothetical protein HOP29_10120 [Phycisphaerales bacterium]|nr:hypothetical protein [Phycisphaerales bacterium]